MNLVKDKSTPLSMLVISLLLVACILKEIKACHKCECDPSGALSSCQNDHCTTNHEYLAGPTKCDSSGRKCCRMMCHGQGSMCMPAKKPCMTGRVSSNAKGCKQGFKCCVPR